jgi:hypothetical protein
LSARARKPSSSGTTRPTGGATCSTCEPTMSTRIAGPTRRPTMATRKTTRRRRKGSQGQQDSSSRKGSCRYRPKQRLRLRLLLMVQPGEDKSLNNSLSP